MRRPIVLILIIIIILSIVRAEYFDYFKSSLETQSGNVVSIDGIVTGIQIKENNIQAIVKVGHEKVLVNIKGLNDAAIYDIYSLAGRKVFLTGLLSLPNGKRNPGGFNYKLYLRSKGIRTIMQVSRFKITGGEIVNLPLNLLFQAKAKFYMSLRPVSGDERFGLISGILFGDTGFLDSDDYKAFQKNGISHILAVSGLHINLAYTFVRKLFKNKKSKTIDAISVLFLVLYAALSNFSVSVLRASLMVILRIISFYLLRRYDSISSVSFAAIIILVINPYELYDSGFILSFTAAFSMSIVQPFLKGKLEDISFKYKNEKIDKVINITEYLLPTFTAFISITPLSIYLFLSFSPLSLILNPIVLLLVNAILPVGIVLFLLFIILPSFMQGYFVYIGGYFLAVLASAIQKINIFGTALFNGIDFPAMPLAMLFLYYIFLFFLCSETHYILLRTKAYLKLSLIISALFTIGSAVPYVMKWTSTILPWKYSTSSITFLDVGQGDCIHIHTAKYDILIDGGGSFYTNVAEKTIKPYLLKNGITKIDLAIITHEDQDHSKGIYELNEIFKIDKIIHNYDVYDYNYDENDKCIVCSVNIEGLKFLFMSDADILREKFLINNFEIDCDVLKIAHHGSNNSTSPDFLDKLSPSFAVISVGENNSYGHPAPRVIELLEKNDIIYARTDKYGAISLKKVEADSYYFENVTKEVIWQVPRIKQNTLQEP